MCVCVRERERDRERAIERETVRRFLHFRPLAKVKIYVYYDLFDAEYT